ncbi:SRPBCC family protein [Paenibacillus qinlingensis]|uniref:Ligand-binding SRPBCC domain-containing protein n=1 Tax=Paenibacillus qinlingensis TaxID=1837343 RepID=A0ABU1NSM1_9BACL|nr:SRPBCC family protein [Paenibacillus qinlingensis]MDR6549877.1 ligand-binding SRPBCC domain-containing protein [Paenibacillus qinlingensis]
MITIVTEIEIEAPIEICFDMASNIDIHTQTVWPHTKERAIAGTMRGLISGGETVTFEARHFFIRQKHTSLISNYVRPYHFVDEMLQGTFKSMRHEHEFIDLGNRTLMKDTLCFEAPLGWIGWVVERVVLKNYMRRFLMYRNHQLKILIEKS